MWGRAWLLVAIATCVMGCETGTTTPSDVDAARGDAGDDASTRLDVRGELREHLHGFAGPTLLVTHDPLDALVLADRIVVLEGGQVTQEGLALEVAQRPATDYVARLLGLNLLRGETADGVVSLDGGGELHVPQADLRGRVLVALRPSAVSLHGARPEGSARNVWRGTVDGVEPIGDRVRVSVLGAPSVVVDVTPGAVVDLGLVRGSQVWLSAKATETEVYPGERRAARSRDDAAHRGGSRRTLPRRVGRG